MLKDTVNKFADLLRSKRFFTFTIVFFIFESTWIALSAVYPQAFDENFHFGLIQVYSHYWLPFLSSQPPHANVFGAVARDPSYLYQYLMSFPYRFVNIFSHNQTIQVIVMRLIDVGLFSTGLVLFRRVLLKAGFSKSIANTSLFLFVLIPIVPLLAAQVNYDDLLFPLVSWTILLTFKAISEFKSRRPSARTLLTLAAVCLITTMVKYAFLPIFLGVVLYLAVVIYKTYRHNLRELAKTLVKSFKELALAPKILLITFLAIGFTLFAQRDLVNVIRYDSVAPNCASVLNVKACSSYSVWYYNYTSHAQVSNKTVTSSENIFAYGVDWLYWMWYRLFFAVNGPNSQFTNYPPLPLPAAAAAIVGTIGIVAVVRWRRKIFHNNPYKIFLIFVAVLYILILFAQGYSSYKYTAIFENMNGRYLLPILLLIVALAGQALGILMRKQRNYKVIGTLVVFALFLQGGGFLTFITRSDPTWDWPNKTVVRVNDAARKITNKVVVNGKKTYATNFWFFN